MVARRVVGSVLLLALTSCVLQGAASSRQQLAQTFASRPENGILRVAMPGEVGVLVAANGGIWTVAQPSRLIELDPATARVERVIDLSVEGEPSSLASGGGKLWMSVLAPTNSGRGSVLRIDPSTGGVTARTSLPAPMQVAAGPEGVWVVGDDNGRLWQLDAITGKVIRSVAVSSCSSDIALGAGSVWVHDSCGKNSIVEIDPRTGRVSETFPGMQGVAVADGQTWMIDHLAHLSRVAAGRATTYRPLTAADEVLSAGGLLWLTRWHPSDLVGRPFYGIVETGAFDPSTGTAVSFPIPLGFDPYAPMLLADGALWAPSLVRSGTNTMRYGVVRVDLDQIGL